ncbi:terminase large subunit domain-containing protein [Candidatus Palauibacter sp.]|uniref:terminase large subunit domain-containing protein n=1 Tax=Candidatus Palauibacter sp. TaxID=3101350 RepID=UPI003CC5B653
MAGNAARAKAVIGWLGALTITEGPRAGERFEVLPFQRRFVRGLVANAEAGLSVGRGCGKTTLAAALAACATAGPLAAVRAQTIIVASSLGQARIAFNHARWFLRPIIERDPKRWRVIEHSHECRIEDRRTGTNLRALGSDPRRAHGLAPKLVIADEPAQWPVNHGQRVHGHRPAVPERAGDLARLRDGRRDDHPHPAGRERRHERRDMVMGERLFGDRSLARAVTGRERVDIGHADKGGHLPRSP